MEEVRGDERTWETRRPDVEGKNCEDCMVMVIIHV